MARSHLIRLQNSDVFSVPKSLGLKAVRQRKSIMCGGMVLSELHPNACLYAQSTIGLDMIVFTSWVSNLLKENGKYPVRGYWSKSIKDLERELQNEQTNKDKLYSY